MATTHRLTLRKRTPRTDPKPVTLWVMTTTENRLTTPVSQDAAATEAIGLQLDAQSPKPSSSPSRTEFALSLKRRTVEFLFDPTSGETRWLHAFGLSDEIDNVARCFPNAHTTSAAKEGDVSSTNDERSVISPSGRIARLQAVAGAVTARPNPKAEAEHDSLVGMLVASGWTWRDANDSEDH